jgi:hypothetical protein
MASVNAANANRTIRGAKPRRPIRREIMVSAFLARDDTHECTDNLSRGLTPENNP